MTRERREQLKKQARSCIESGLPWRITLSAQEFLDLSATEPVADAEVAEEVAWLKGLAERHRMERFARVAALIERLARQVAEIEAALPDYRRDPCNQPENMR